MSKINNKSIFIEKHLRIHQYYKTYNHKLHHVEYIFIIFHHSIQLDEASGSTFYNEVDYPN